MSDHGCVGHVFRICSNLGPWEDQEQWPPFTAKLSARLFIPSLACLEENCAIGAPYLETFAVGNAVASADCSWAFTCYLHCFYFENRSFCIPITFGN